MCSTVYQRYQLFVISFLPHAIVIIPERYAPYEFIFTLDISLFKEVIDSKTFPLSQL